MFEELINKSESFHAKAMECYNKKDYKLAIFYNNLAISYKEKAYNCKLPTIILRK